MQADSRQVIIRDVTPREGGQRELLKISTSQRRELINKIVRAGLKHIEVTAFLSRNVAWHKDAAEVTSGLTAIPGVEYTALYLKPYGFDEVIKYGVLKPEGVINLSMDEEYLGRNYGINDLQSSLDTVEEWTEYFAKTGHSVDRVMLSYSWGVKNAVEVLDYVDQVRRKIRDTGQRIPIKEITFADTEGLASPQQIGGLVQDAGRTLPDLKIGIHLHPDPGIANDAVCEAVRAGVGYIDTAVLGIGGSPNAHGACGNLNTRTVVETLERLGICTGVDLSKLGEAEKFVKSLCSKL